MDEQPGLFGEPEGEQLQPHQWPWCMDCRTRHEPGRHDPGAFTTDPGRIIPGRDRSPADDPTPVRVVQRAEPERPLGSLRAPRKGTWAARVLDIFVRDYLVGGQSVAETEVDHRTRRLGYTDEMLSAVLNPEGTVAYATIRGRRVDLVHWGWLRDSGHRDHGHRWWELTPGAEALIRGGWRPPTGAATPEAGGDRRVGGAE